MVTIILAIAIFWFALSLVAGLLFGRMATLHKRALVEEVERDPQLQLAPAPPCRAHVA